MLPDTLPSGRLAVETLAKAYTDAADALEAAVKADDVTKLDTFGPAGGFIRDSNDWKVTAKQASKMLRQDAKRFVQLTDASSTIQHSAAA